MKYVLVVDDSPMDSRLVGRMLERRADYRVEYAGDGRQALARMESERPSAVVTDLRMPEMDGMELVEAVRRRFAKVPVILMTAHGSEEIAAEALKRGAADYVPKAKLSGRLLASLEDVVSTADEQSHRLLVPYLRHEELRYELPNDPSLIPPLVARLRRTAVELGLVDETDGMRLARALAEALRNAIYHGNLELPLGEFEDGESLTARDTEVIAALRQEAPYRNRRVHLTATIGPQEAQFIIRDEGPGFNTAELPDLGQDPSPLCGGGRHGLVLIRTFMDEVRFNSFGNVITLVKRAPGQSG